MTGDKVLKARGRRGLRRHRKQRQARGWSEFDAWNVDNHVLRVIGEMALHLRDNRHVYPAALTDDEWKRILTDVAVPLLDYADHLFDYPADPGLRDRAACALNLFAEWFDGFWY